MYTALGNSAGNKSGSALKTFGKERQVVFPQGLVTTVRLYFYIIYASFDITDFAVYPMID